MSGRVVGLEAAAEAYRQAWEALRAHPVAAPGYDQDTNLRLVEEMWGARDALLRVARGEDS